MNELKEYLIQFSGLKLGKHQFEFQINNTFFEYFDYQEFNNSEIKVNLVLEKKSTILELSFDMKGFVNVPCDLTNENFDMKIKSKSKLLVKFGEEFNDEHDEFLILPHGEFQVNVSQFIYENLVLSIPAKRIHPGVKDGTLQSETLEVLEKLSIKESEKIETKTEETDPRWDNLKKLLTDKK
jgi:uncharacterized metal-binding protein YceD (DUF177 family)